MRSLILFVLGSVLAVASIPNPQGRDGDQFTIAVDVDLIVFNVTVTDNRGRHVSALKSSDFQIFEEGRLQSMTLFRAEDSPATVGLVLDNSGSMSERRADVAEAALDFVTASNSDDEVFIVNFNERVYLALPRETPFTSDLAQIRLALLKTVPAGRTALYDAMAVGLDHLKAGTRDRKALVVLSDGGDNASGRKLDEVLQIAQRSSATIYTIGIYDESDADRNTGVLRKIAQLTGGRAYFPDSREDLGKIWTDIAGGIRSQYTIGYRSTNTNRDGSFRKVTIVARSNGGRVLRVTTREGFIAPSEKLVPPR